MSLTNADPVQAARGARLASRTLAILPASARNHALTAMHAALAAAQQDILAANARDLAAATQAAQSGELKESLIKRLDLGRKGKYEDMLQGILDVRDLDDPLGKIDARTLLDDGLLLERISSPIGVLLIIFEARPEVIANIASLAIKSGNAAILKGGKESSESFVAISSVISDALRSTAVPNDGLQLVTTRDAIKPLLELDQYIDLVIPRGSNELVSSIKKGTQIPVLGHADGLCSIYLRADCPIDMATRVIVDAKTSYPAACNSVETLLVDEDALSTVLPPVAEALVQKGVRLRCDGASKAALVAGLDKHQATFVQDAQEQDFRTEFLDLVLAVKTIPRMASADEAADAAIGHINEHSSHHTDAILTQCQPIAEQFQGAVDSACVFWNTSTRMADGQRFGFGTEVGISTNKIHARGPVGLEGLTIYRWLIKGNGQVSAEYGAGGKAWKHETLAAGDLERYAATQEEWEAVEEVRRARRGHGGASG